MQPCAHFIVKMPSYQHSDFNYNKDKWDLWEHFISVMEILIPGKRVIDCFNIISFKMKSNAHRQKGSWGLTGADRTFMGPRNPNHLLFVRYEAIIWTSPNSSSVRVIRTVSMKKYFWINHLWNQPGLGREKWVKKIFATEYNSRCFVKLNV